MKPWNDNASMDEILEELNLLMELVCPKKHRLRPKNLDYQGFDIDLVEIKAVSASPAEQLSKEGLKRNRENGRDTVNVLFAIAYQLGFCKAAKMKDKYIKILTQLIEGYEAEKFK